MNPIEHVWNAQGRRVAGRQPLPQTLQELERAVLEQVLSIEECPADAYLVQVSCPRQEVCEFSNLSHLTKRRGFGMHGRILQFRYPALIVGAKISDSEITPLQELKVFCGLTITGESRIDLESRKDFVCRIKLVLTSRLPDRKRFTDLSSPPIPIIALLIANGDFVNIPLSGKYRSKNLLCAAISSTLRLCNARPLPGHSFIGSIGAKTTSSWCASTHHGVL
ncbi:hypothetical protein TNCV_3210031 [Trichonephila clavipes]|nr:hypothetical protein TNCV_3210031 [Trichonephila clavipes]